MAKLLHMIICLYEKATRIVFTRNLNWIVVCLHQAPAKQKRY